MKCDGRESQSVIYKRHYGGSPTYFPVVGKQEIIPIVSEG